MVVIKRDGREVEFDKNKIVNAIEKAMIRTADGINHDISLSVSNKVYKEISDKGLVGVENIQDIVEQKLMQSSRKDVAKEYITYRNERNRIRNKNSQLNKKVKDILKAKNVTNDNANLDQYSFSGKENTILENYMKEYTSDELLSEDVAKAEKDGKIYIHDKAKYPSGMSNCLFADVGYLLANGFSTRNGDVRPANSISTAMQLVAVIFQLQSQTQYGGVASSHIDYDLAPYVKKSFVKHYKTGIKYLEEGDEEIGIATGELSIEDKKYKRAYPKAYKYAMEMLNKEGKQAAQAMFHNLNTLESRSGAQLPFTSINFGTDTSREGQLVSEWILNASIEGIGRKNKTPIFPISIFQYKKGVNDKEGTPNYYLKKLAIKSMSKRIYPNWVNCDWSQHKEDPNNIDTIKATMGKM